MSHLKKTTVNSDELRHFQKFSHGWWDERGPFSALHALNPVRLQYIKDQIHQVLGQTFSQLKILDIGCGGGLLTEPLARLGAHVTGIDATPENIVAAQRHAQAQGLNIGYECRSIETFSTHNHDKFDVVTALEILEHVNNTALFLESSAKTLRAGGLFIASTFHRTPKSFLLGIVMAEYVLRWAPRGTHSWKKFIKPSELTRDAERAGLHLLDVVGVRYNPFDSKWEMCQDPRVNYMALFQKG